MRNHKESVVTPVERSAADADRAKVDLNQAASLQAPSSEVDDAVPLEQYRLAFERNPQPMWVYDLDSLRLIAVNDAAIAHYGYSRAKFLSMTIRDLRPGDELPSLEENLSAGSHGFERSGGWRHRKKDGTIIDVEIVSHELTFAGRRAGLVLATDVTARRSAENAQRAQLVVAQRLVDSTTIDEAGPKLLDALGSTMGWDAATIWRVDGASEVLRFDTFWSVPTADPGLTAELEHSLRSATFRTRRRLGGPGLADRRAGLRGERPSRRGVSGRRGPEARFASPRGGDPDRRQQWRARGARVLQPHPPPDRRRLAAHADDRQRSARPVPRAQARRAGARLPGAARPADRPAQPRAVPGPLADLARQLAPRAAARWRCCSSTSTTSR